MALNRVDFPNVNPVDLTDWAKMIDLIEALSLKINVPVDYDFSSNTIKKGTVIMIGGTIYLADSDTAITGTPSDFVKITPSGAIAAAAYVASLSGVTWNDTYNFYEDVSNNAYIFDETKVVAAGTVTDPKTIMGKFAYNGWQHRRLIDSTHYVHSNMQLGAFYAIIAPFVPNIGDEIFVSGSFGKASLSRIERTGALEITTYGCFGDTGGLSTIAMISTDVSSGNFSVSW